MERPELSHRFQPKAETSQYLVDLKDPTLEPTCVWCLKGSQRLDPARQLDRICTDHRYMLWLQYAHIATKGRGTAA